MTYAEDFGDQRLAGKTLHYEVEVKGIKTKTMPELDDEWVKELGQEGMNTLEELRARVRSGMEHEKQHQAEQRSKEDLLRQLTDKYPIDVPTMLVENAVDQRLERGLRSLIGQGLRAEDIKRMDMSKLRGRPARRRAARRAGQPAAGKDRRAGRHYGERRRRGPGNRGAAQQSKQNPLAMRKQLEEKNGLEGLRSQLRCDRALDWLYKHSE